METPRTEPCPRCGGPTEWWTQEGRPTRAIRCLKNGCVWGLKNHLVVCADCTAGQYCEEGLALGGWEAHLYLNRITADNGCRT